MDDYVSLTDAAGIIGCSYSTAKRWAREGKMPVSRIGRATLVNRGVANLMRERRLSSLAKQGGVERRGRKGAGVSSPAPATPFAAVKLDGADARLGERSAGGRAAFKAAAASA